MISLSEMTSKGLPDDMEEGDGLSFELRHLASC